MELGKVTSIHATAWCIGRSKVTGCWAEETACPHARMKIQDSFCASVISTGAHFTPLLSLIVVKNWDYCKPGLDTYFYISLSISWFYNIQIRERIWNFTLITNLTWQEYVECLQRWIFLLAERYANIKIIEKCIPANGMLCCVEWYRILHTNPDLVIGHLFRFDRI